MAKTRTGRPPTYPMPPLSLTQKEIAEAVGLTQPQVSRLLRGGRVCIRIADVGTIANALGMSADDLVGMYSK